LEVRLAETDIFFFLKVIEKLGKLLDLLHSKALADLMQSLLSG
jgi:hypothetical protein